MNGFWKNNEGENPIVVGIFRVMRISCESRILEMVR